MQVGTRGLNPHAALCTVMCTLTEGRHRLAPKVRQKVDLHRGQRFSLLSSRNDWERRRRRELAWTGPCFAVAVLATPDGRQPSHCGAFSSFPYVCFRQQPAKQNQAKPKRKRTNESVTLKVSNVSYLFV